MLAHTVLYSEATRNIDAEFSSGHVRSPTEKSNYQFKRSKSLLVELTKWLFSLCVLYTCRIHWYLGGNLRVLFAFKPYGCRQHLVLRTEVQYTL